MERVAVGRLKGSIAGSGTLSLAGTTRELDASIAGSGGIAAGGLVAESARVSVMGSGDVRDLKDGRSDSLTSRAGNGWSPRNSR